MKSYNAYVFEKKPVWTKIKKEAMDCFLWNTERYKPNCYFQMCIERSKGLYIRLTAQENNPLTLYTKRDEPVYRDSCLEAFLSFGKEGYMNIETNSNGTFLSEFGEKRENRKFLKDITDISPVVLPFKTQSEWGNEIFVPNELIAYFYPDFNNEWRFFTANFTKCGDATQIPHYCSFSPLGDFSKGFHNPEKFVPIYVLKEE